MTPIIFSRPSTTTTTAMPPFYYGGIPAPSFVELTDYGGIPAPAFLELRGAPTRALPPGTSSAASAALISALLVVIAWVALYLDEQTLLLFAVAAAALVSVGLSNSQLVLGTTAHADAFLTGLLIVFALFVPKHSLVASPWVVTAIMGGV